ncbi:hypothetical protein TWF694_002153 [Orbilia ellipsospora]|uniref:Rhodopsin domain-containing protein n=1 Tax=Orbilia ellipsospora TaxID=2528407 RepID=A0AAV9X4X8_9PEZI
MYIPKTLDEALLLARIVQSINGAAILKSLPASASAPNYVPPNRGNEVLIVAIVSMSLAVIMVVLRLYTRKVYAGRFGWDDWLIIPATITAMGFTSIQIIGVIGAHMGMHVYDISPYAMIEGTKLTYAHMILYIFAITFTKLSIILFLRRFSVGVMRHVHNGYIAFHILLGVASVLALAFQCKPVSAAYDLITKLQHKCNGLTMYYAITSLGVASDIAILLLPVPGVLKLQLPAYKKVAVLTVFGIGGLACVFAILRMINLFSGVKGIDLTWDIVPIALYGQLEVTTAIIATSLPALRLLWKGWLPRHRLSIGPLSPKFRRSNPSDRSGGGSSARTRRSDLGKGATTAAAAAVTFSERTESHLDTDIEADGGDTWRRVEYEKGIPVEDSPMDGDSGWRREEGTSLSATEGTLMDDQIRPMGPSPTMNRSRRNSNVASDTSTESGSRLGNLAAGGKELVETEAPPTSVS